MAGRNADTIYKRMDRVKKKKPKIEGVDRIIRTGIT
jgi:hypothetical protein